MFVHLRARSYYSFLDALPSPAGLVQAAAAQGMPALGLTERLWLTGAVEFYDACRAAGVKPILGLELDVSAPGDIFAASAAAPLALLAMNFHGWGSLCRLSSAALSDPAGERPLPFAQLAQEAGGLICLTGGRSGLAARLLRESQPRAAASFLAGLNEIFPGRLYIELQLHTPDDAPIAEQLHSLAQRLDLPVVATHSIHYLSADEAALQRVQAAIRRLKALTTLETEEIAPPQAYFLPAGEMETRFAAYRQGLAASAEIAARCNLELPLGTPHFPEVPLPPGMHAIELLRQKAEAGAKKLYALPEVGSQLSVDESLSPQASEIFHSVRARLSHELGVIDEMGYAPLFLVMEEIISETRRLGIPYSSRGSAASSLVAHCLGITSPDPIRLNLYFERFLNPARSTPPDIDTDLCSRRRDEVIDFVYRRFGADRVAMVCTINRFRRRSALRETAKAHGLAPKEVSALAEGLPQRWYGPPWQNDNAAAPYAELIERHPSPAYRNIFRDAAALIGIPHHLSVHPGGIVIAPETMTELVPVHLAAKGILVTQFDLESIERLGLVKMDLLGIRGLTVLGDVAAAVQSATTDSRE